MVTVSSKLHQFLFSLYFFTTFHVYCLVQYIKLAICQLLLLLVLEISLLLAHKSTHYASRYPMPTLSQESKTKIIVAQLSHCYRGRPPFCPLSYVTAIYSNMQLKTALCSSRQCTLIMHQCTIKK